jgi:hypothetical protein
LDRKLGRNGWVELLAGGDGAPLTHSSHSPSHAASAHSARLLSRARAVSPCRRRAGWPRLRAWRCYGTSGNTPRDRGRRCAAARQMCRSERRPSRRWASGLSLFHVRRPCLVGRAPLREVACPSLPRRRYMRLYSVSHEVPVPIRAAGCDGRSGSQVRPALLSSLP